MVKVVIFNFVTALVIAIGLPSVDMEVGHGTVGGLDIFFHIFFYVALGLKAGILDGHETVHEDSMSVTKVIIFACRF